MLTVIGFQFILVSQDENQQVDEDDSLMASSPHKQNSVLRDNVPTYGNTGSTCCAIHSDCILSFTKLILTPLHDA
jgi:hypothetical protein